MSDATTSATCGHPLFDARCIDGTCTRSVYHQPNPIAATVTALRTQLEAVTADRDMRDRIALDFCTERNAALSQLGKARESLEWVRARYCQTSTGARCMDAPDHVCEHNIARRALAASPPAPRVHGAVNDIGTLPSHAATPLPPRAECETCKGTREVLHVYLRGDDDPPRNQMGPCPTCAGGSRDG